MKKLIYESLGLLQIPLMIWGMIQFRGTLWGNVVAAWLLILFGVVIGAIIKDEVKND